MISLSEQTMNKLSNTYIHNPNFDSDSNPEPIPPCCVKLMEERKLERKIAYFERMIGTDFGVAVLTEVNGEERLWGYAEKAEAQERFEVSMAAERNEERLDQHYGKPEKFGDPRQASTPDRDWDVGQLFLWERSQYEEMMERKGVEE